MVPEAPLERTEAGLGPAGEGWFVINARESRWYENEDFPGKPACMYHREDDQEDFLVLSGECLLLVEEQERRLQAWDFFHCPPETDHVLVGAGDGPCVVVAVGSRSGGKVVYPVSDLAQKHGAGVAEEAHDGATAYAGSAKSVQTPFREGWLPD